MKEAKRGSQGVVGDVNLQTSLGSATGKSTGSERRQEKAADSLGRKERGAERGKAFLAALLQEEKGESRPDGAESGRRGGGSYGMTGKQHQRSFWLVERFGEDEWVRKAGEKGLRNPHEGRTCRRDLPGCCVSSLLTV